LPDCLAVIGFRNAHNHKIVAVVTSERGQVLTSPQCLKVRSSGEIKWKGAKLYVTEALIGQVVGLSKQTNGNWLVRFADVPLGYIDRSNEKLFRFGPGRPPRTKAETAPQL